MLFGRLGFFLKRHCNFLFLFNGKQADKAGKWSPSGVRINVVYLALQEFYPRDSINSPSLKERKI